MNYHYNQQHGWISWAQRWTKEDFASDIILGKEHEDSNNKDDFWVLFLFYFLFWGVVTQDYPNYYPEEFVIYLGVQIGVNEDLWIGRGITKDVLLK